ncbi:glycosyltransferase [Methanobacterium sp. MB1]|nr:glycosyltransferase [Methanobacterium sp. MB1]
MSVKQKFRSNISIVILNWNGWKDTIECLESLFHINYPHYQIVVVDNGSQDSSVQRIRDYLNGQISIKLPFLKNHTNFFLHPMQEYSLDEINSDSFTLRNDSLDIPGEVFLIKCPENNGFAEGNNIGIKFSLKNLDSDYVLLLNNDTLVESDFLDKLVEIAETYQQIGVVGPKVCYYHQPHIINSAGVIMDWYSGMGCNQGINKVDNGWFDTTLDFDALIGVCLLVRASIFEKVGYLDEKFFLLLEETDFCLRVKKK